MNRRNKAFTIVELIIVIAVIGVLAAILIPTFSGVIDKANAKSALSDAKNMLTSYISCVTEDKTLPSSVVIITKKAGSFYLFGYSTQAGVLMQSKSNPYSGYSDVSALIDAQNYVEGGTQDGKAISLVASRSVSYNDLSDELGTTIDGTVIYHGTLLASVAVSVGNSASQSGIYFTDMKGRSGYLEKPAERVVALQAADCEILCALGARATLVGRGTYCDYPTDISTVPAVDSGLATNVEQIIAIAPDVIIMPTMNQSVEQVAAFENAGIVTVVTEAFSIDGAYEAIRLIGKITGHDAEAEALVADMQSNFEQIRNLVPVGEKKKVYFEVSSAAWGNPWTAGTGSFMNEFAEMLNLENIFSDLSGWAEVSSEQIIARNPDYIITVDVWSGGAAEIIARDGYSSINAVANGDVFVLSSDNANAAQRPGPRLADAFLAIYNCIYGA